MPRGDASALLLDALAGARARAARAARRAVDVADPLADDDLQLALYLCYELHYRGLPGVDERWEWEPSLLRAARASSRRSSRTRCCAAVGAPERRRARAGRDGPRPARRSLDADDGAVAVALPRARRRRCEQFLEFVVHRSAYQLKEADPHSWAIPRLSGPPKAALVEIQADEYGGGRARPHPRRSCSPTTMDGARARPHATAPTSTVSPASRWRPST